MSSFFLILVGLILLTLALRVAAWLWFTPILGRMFAGHSWLPGVWHAPLAEGEPVEFSARDGLRLRGTYLPTLGFRRRGVVVFCHELNGDRWNAVPYTEDLRCRGFDVFTFDFRNHGESGRAQGYEPTPWVTEFEVADVRAAIDYVSSRCDAVLGGLGLMGVSRGATAALCAAADDRRVRALVVDSLCPTERMQFCALRRLLRSSPAPIRWLARLPAPLLGLLGAWSRLLLGHRRRCVFVPVDEAARNVEAPVFVIHGQRDACVPGVLIRAFCRWLLEDAKFWLVPRAGHHGALAVAPEIYRRRIARFFLDHLAVDSPWQELRQTLRAPASKPPNGAPARNTLRAS